MKRLFASVRPHWDWLILLGPALILAIGLGREVGVAIPSVDSGPATSTNAPQAPRASARQVTLFGIKALPGKKNIDPQLREVADQLRKLLPDHGFKLLGTENKRIAVGQMVECDLGRDLLLKAELVDALDNRGKVQIKIALAEDAQELFGLSVSTPPDQLFFLDKKLDDDTRLLIGVGAR